MEILDSDRRPAAQQHDAQRQVADAPPFGISSLVPHRAEAALLVQRGEAVDTLWRKMSDPQTSVLALTGSADAGKSTLAAIVYWRLQDDYRRGLSTPRHLIWLTPSIYATVSDVIAAILSRISHTAGDPAFFHLLIEQQMTLLLDALRRESAFIVVDQFDTLLSPASPHAIIGYDRVIAFLDLLQTNLGPSRILLTMNRLPEGLQRFDEGHVRALPVPRVSTQEGGTLLQQCGVQGTFDELSRVWQRCDGKVFGLVLFSALVKLSGTSPDYLVHAPEYQRLTSSEYTYQLAVEVCERLRPTQYTLMQTLCLFSEPLSLHNMVAISKRRQAHLTLSECEQEIAALAQLSLVQHTVDEQGITRYMVHSLLRRSMVEHYRNTSSQYAGRSSSSLGVSTQMSPEKKELEAQQAACTVHLHIAGYYKNLAKKRCPTREQRSSLRDIEPLLMAIRHLCLGRQWQRAFDYFSQEGLYDNLMQWGKLDTLIALLRHMLPPFGMLQLPDEGLVACTLGRLFAMLGNNRQGVDWYQGALTIQLQINDWRSAVETFISLGELLRAIGDQQQARLSFEQALRLNAKTPHPLSECLILHNLGILYQAAAEYQQAMNYYQAAMKLAHGLQEAGREGIILTNIAMLLYEQGQYAEALTVMRYAIHLRRSLNDQSVNLLYPFYTMLEQNFASHVPVQQAAQETPPGGNVRQSLVEHVTDTYDAARFSHAALETVKHAAIQRPQANRQPGMDAEAMNRLQQSFLETQRVAAVMPSRGKGKLPTKQSGRKTSTRPTESDDSDAPGRLGATSLWTNGSF